MGLTVQCSIKGIKVAWLYAMQKGLGSQDNIKENPSLRSIWEKYYEEAHAVVFVIDASCPSRFEDSKSALEKVIRHEDLQGAPLLILANKQVK
ncbi:ADP-ribosylation factor-related protein 1 [Vitis vinifera]|uniref:ADP-ribosylation factor-related protein 1 n=1 Tax=Vitis vinifera TaxID=29760 RepID=A0A438BUV9_VITVI|nr:ADP-ribosylation factor-related protein 1 [Vitis vinifera]